MAKQKPTIEKIEEYLKKYNPLDLSEAKVDLFNAHNHIHYRVEKGGRVCCLRIINPESYRADEWLTIPDEYTLLRLLGHSGLAPRALFVDPERLGMPFMIQEFVADAVCFKDLGVLQENHLIAAAEAIAEINSQKITPEIFPFREKFTRYSYLTSIRTWREQLDIIMKNDQFVRGYELEVSAWAKKIEDVVNQAEKRLKGFEPLLEKASWCFNFDGAHIGNTYSRSKKVIFLDWQKASFGDPAFTLARFLTSIELTGEVVDEVKNIMLQAYLKKREVPGFVGLLKQRLFERQVADLVWVVWNYVKERKAASGLTLEKATSVQARYERVEKMLRE